MMATVDVRDATGTKVGERDLPDALFERTVNVPLMHQVVVAGARGASAPARTPPRPAARSAAAAASRGARRAPAAPARVRSGRPHWAGGGVAHGPIPATTRMRVNKKMQAAALRCALTDASQSGKLAVVDAFEFDEPQDQGRRGAAPALELDGKVLLVLARADGARRALVPQPRPRQGRLPGPEPRRRTTLLYGRPRPVHRGRARRPADGKAAEPRRPTTTRPSRRGRSEGDARGRRPMKTPRDVIIRPIVSREVLRGPRAQRVHVPGRPGREQDRDQGGDPADLERPGHLA